jgi:biopolymer transport protein ExbD
MKWDLYQPDRMTVLRAWTTEQVQAALASGELDDSTLARPAGSDRPWSRLRDLPDLMKARRGEGGQPESWRLPGTASTTPARRAEPAEDASVRVRGIPPAPASAAQSSMAPSGETPPRSQSDTPRTAGVQEEPVPSLVAEIDDVSIEAEPFEDILDQDRTDDEEAAEFTLAPRSSTRSEELDLTAMVDVAFQLILFFLVTATVAFYKTLQIPEPPKEQDRPNVTQARSLSEIQTDHILVEIDAGGTILVDHEPVPPEALVKRLITARRDTGRPGMLLLADYQALHRFAVLVTDAANEAGLQIKFGKPTNAPPMTRAP